MSTNKLLSRVLHTAATALIVAASWNAQAAPLNISNAPLFLNGSVPPLNMIVMGRDHKLYYEAYNDASDLNDDGVLDTKYKGFELKVPAPTEPGVSIYKIDYFGYFDSYKCYTFNGSFFDPVAVVGAGKTCSGNWSGDYLNYLTTARIDALRKVLYGGDRSTDSTTDTILERTYVPQDAHSWGKEYTSIAVDGYDIANYSPLSSPTAGTRHFFANTTPRGAAAPGAAVYTTAPVLRWMANVGSGRRIWNWVSKERPVAHNSGNCIDGMAGCPAIVDYIVRVKVCKTGYLEVNCKQYPNGSYKPTGLIQDYGEGASPRMYFGLMTGSYAKNTSGGVLRRQMGSPTFPLSNEIDANSGQFLDVDGIVRTFNRLHATGFRQDPNFDYTCGWITNGPIGEGTCQMWGNPIAEIMYESARYFAGRAAPTGAFATTFGQGEEGQLPGGGLPIAAWNDPYGTGGHARCAKPFQTVISDINPTYDSDQLPGVDGNFGAGIANDLPGALNVSAIGQTIWNNEFGGSRNIFIGQSGASVNSGPTPKVATSFGNLRGLAPEDPTKQGSYYAASVAYHAHETDLNPATGQQKLTTFAVALASPLPKIAIPVAGRTVTLVPFAKSVAGSGINAASNQFQPTNQIVDFYVDTITPTTGRFRVNFEDVEQGADHDMDAIVTYEYSVVGSTVSVRLISEYAAGGITQHMGYIISGTTQDGIYLEVLDQRTGDVPNDTDYFLDTPPGVIPPALPAQWQDGASLPFDTTRTFTAGATAGAELLKDPLWYAAKWGGFEDSDANGLPNLSTEWDENGDGKPDNYFLVTNALTLGQQLANAFDEIISRVGSASSASVNSGQISSTTRVYQAKFNSGDWTGSLLSFPVQSVDNPATPENEIGQLLAQEWDAADQLPAFGSRQIVTTTSAGVATPFRWATIGATRQSSLQPLADGLGSQRLDYLRGDGSRERTTGGPYRNRPRKLGDIVSSSPIFVGAPSFGYPEALETVPYSTFATAPAQLNRPGMVYVGSNDGMLHAFNADTGVERFAFIPGSVFSNLHELTKPAYTHFFYVDGTPTAVDMFNGTAWRTMLIGGLNRGGRSIYALDITNPAGLTEANATSVFKWEYTDADLGYTYSRPQIVRMANGVWAAIFGNGYQPTTPTGTGRAYLYIVNAWTGALIRKIDTGVGDLTTPNGLATPVVIDTNRDSIADYAYAGDLQGNMWKFNLLTGTTTNWVVANGAPLFVARDALNNRQPITSQPEVGRGPGGVGMVVLFGTGKFLELVDKAPTRTQTFYGVYDQNTGTSADIVSGRAVMTQQEIIQQSIVTFTSPSGVSLPLPLRVTSANPVGGATGRGWYMDLLTPPGVFTGEMQVSDSVLRNGRIIFTTLIPDADPCSPGGTSWLMEMEALSGARLENTPYDNNRDGIFDDSDLVEIVQPDGTRIRVAASGLGSEVGIAATPGIAFSDGGGAGGSGRAADSKYLSGTTPNRAGSNIQIVTENPGEGVAGRQSWRQVR